MVFCAYHYYVLWIPLSKAKILLPVMSEENVWNKMDWETNYAETDERYGGMLAGIVAGAAAGSVIPGVGTAIGAGLGVLAGVFAQSKMDERSGKKERQKFGSSCINKTVTAFYEEPSMYVKKEIQNYMDELFSRIEKDLPQKCRKIRDELVERAAADQEYYESAQLLEELLKYRHKIRTYSESSNLKFQVQQLKFSRRMKKKCSV